LGRFPEICRIDPGEGVADCIEKKSYSRSRR
jgi:hypothetical protein